jgi:hypothetical protein
VSRRNDATPVEPSSALLFFCAAIHAENVLCSNRYPTVVTIKRVARPLARRASSILDRTSRRRHR